MTLARFLGMLVETILLGRKAIGLLVMVVLCCVLQACDWDSGSDSDSGSGSDQGKLISFGLVVADINRDTRPDIVTANTDFSDSANSGSVKVILQDGVIFGDFDEGEPYPMGADTVDLAVGDVNGDGKPDVLSTSRSEGALYYRLQTAAGTGQLGDDEELEVGLRPGAIAFADINGDTFNDIIVSGTSLVYWLFEPADPDDPDDVDEYVFGGRELISGQTLAVALLNDDNRLDIIAGSSDTEISVLLQDPTILPGLAPVFFPAEVYDVGVRPSDIEVADLVSSDLLNPTDSLPDIAVVSRDFVSVLRQRAGGAGEFNLAVQYPIRGNGAQLVIADLNNDAYLDLAATNNLAVDGGISLLLRSVAAGTDEFIAGTYIRATSPWGLGAADFDRLGGVDLAFSNVDGAWVVLQNRLLPGEFLLPELVGGDNNADD